MELLFVDSSAWFALVNQNDPDHGAVEGILQEFGGRLVTSNFVLDETLTLCRVRVGHEVAVRVGRAILDSQVVRLIRLSQEDEYRAWELFLARPDKVYSFTDCTSFVLMRRLSIERVASLDDDFAREGFRVLPG